MKIEKSILSIVANYVAQEVNKYIDRETLKKVDGTSYEYFYKVIDEETNEKELTRINLKLEVYGVWNSNISKIYGCDLLASIDTEGDIYFTSGIHTIKSGYVSATGWVDIDNYTNELTTPMQVTRLFDETDIKEDMNVIIKKVIENFYDGLHKMLYYNRDYEKSVSYKGQHIYCDGSKKLNPKSVMYDLELLGVRYR